MPTSSKEMFYGLATWGMFQERSPAPLLLVEYGFESHRDYVIINPVDFPLLGSFIGLISFVPNCLKSVQNKLKRLTTRQNEV
jgi:hypothetical protein